MDEERTTVPWQVVGDDAPDLAAAAQARFEWTKHHVLATVRKDGSPRVSGTEVQFKGGQAYLGCMYRSVKALDLLRDPRFALHSNPGDGSLEGGDARLSGRAIEVHDPDELAAYIGAVSPPEPFHLFRLELGEVVLVSLHPDGDRLVIDRWTPGGRQVIERA